MQYISPKIIHTRGFVKIRYRTVFLVMALAIAFQFGSESYVNLTSLISDVISPRTKKLLVRQQTPPHSYIGFAASVLPRMAAGRMSELFSAKWLLFIGVCIHTICMLLMPMAINILENNVLYMDAIHVVMMLSQGLVWPAAIVLVVRWAPPEERFLMGPLVHCSMYFGDSLGVFISAWVAVTLGWKYTFYVSAGLNALLLISFVKLVRDDPSEDENLGLEERRFIMNSLKSELYQYRRKFESRLPWRDIIQSRPLWASLIIQLEFEITLAILRVTIYEERREFRTNNVMSPLNQAVILTLTTTQVAMAFLLFGLIFYNLVMEGVKKVRVYNISNIIFLLGAGMITVYYYNYRKLGAYQREITSALVLFTHSCRFTSTTYFWDLAPNYAGTLNGFQYTVTNLPVFAFQFFKVYDTVDMWRRVVVLFSAFYLCLVAFVSIPLISGEVQLWNNHCHLLATDDLYHEDADDNL